MTLRASLLVLLAAPFTRDPRIIGWTYLGFVLPLALGWDGAVSCLRAHEPAELLELGREAAPHYEWSSSATRVGWWPIWVTYVVGLPRQEAQENGATPERRRA